MKNYLSNEYWAGRIVDAHSHFFPYPMFKAIWKYFENKNWPIVQKGTPEELADNLRICGVKHYTLLNYAHKQGVAHGLNHWTAQFAEAMPGSIPFFTVHPEDPDNAGMARDLLNKGFMGLKVQPLVQNFNMDDSRVLPVYEELVRAGKWLVIHAGTAPWANEYVGVRNFRRLIDLFPDMKIIVAHMGAYETEAFFDLMDSHPNMRLDTTMVFVDTHVFDNSFPDKLLDRMASLTDRILFGSDYPNIPYKYGESINGLLRLGLEEAAYEKIFHKNAQRDFGLK